MSLQESTKITHEATDPQSSILYFIQEASKLVLPSKVQDQSIPDDRKSEQRQSSKECMSLSLFSGGQQGRGILQANAPLVQASSPLDVMYLINQQCELLLHPGLGGKEAGVSYSLCLSNSSDAEGLICGENSTSCSSCPSHSANNTTTDVSDRQDTDDTEEVGVQGGTEPISDDSVKSPRVTTDDDSSGALQVNLSDHNYSFSVSTECCLEDCVELLCAEVVTESGRPLLPDWRPVLDCQEGGKTCHNPSRKADEPNSIAVMEAVLNLAEEEGVGPDSDWALDYNNNMELQDLSAVQKCMGAEISMTPLKLGLPTGQAHCSECVSPHNQKDEACTETQGNAHVPGPELSNWRGRTPRKQAHPSRSADPHDPNLQGVIFSMNTEMDGGSNQCRLLITSNYSSKELPSRGYKRRRLPREASSSDEGGEEDESICSFSGATKTCASCCTRKTPLWRDAEDGTPLCNACGIRYKKYRVRCSSCWHIPRKDSKSKANCFKCGDVLRSSAQHKRGEW